MIRSFICAWVEPEKSGLSTVSLIKRTPSGGRASKQLRRIFRQFRSFQSCKTVAEKDHICTGRIRSLKKIGRNRGKPTVESAGLDVLFGQLAHRRQIGDDAAQVSLSEA